jgi:hypothetical protein
MADYPDIYTDGFGVSVGPFGLTLTLYRTEPTGEPGAHEEPREIVARIRMNMTMGQAIGEAMEQMAAAAAQGIQQSQSTIKH